MQIISPFDEHNRTLVENVHPPDDREAAEVFKKSMLRDGVRLCGGAKQLKVARPEEGKRLRVDGGDAPYDLVVDETLVGAGRAPNVEGLGLETVGVECNEVGVKVDDRLRTTNRRTYAVGDIDNRTRLTPRVKKLFEHLLQMRR